MMSISKITLSKLRQNPLPAHVSPEKHLRADKETSPKRPKKFGVWFLLCLPQPPLSWGALCHVPISLWQSQPQLNTPVLFQLLLVKHSGCCWRLGKGIHTFNHQASSYSNACRTWSHSRMLWIHLFYLRIPHEAFLTTQSGLREPPWFQWSNMRETCKVINPVQLNNVPIAGLWLMTTR